MDAFAAADADTLAVRAASLLFANGQTTERVTLTVEQLAGAAGRSVTVAPRWGELTFDTGDGSPLRQAVLAPLGVDIRKVLATERVVDDVCAGRCDAACARARLDEVGRLPPVSLLRFAVMAAAGAGALGLIFGAADVRSVAAIAGSAGLGALLRRGVSHVSANPFAQPFVAALLAGLIASLAMLLRLPVSYRLLAVCPCMVLVPGPHFLNGWMDLAHARIPLGAARLAFASLIAVAISTGLLAGLSFATPLLPAAQPASVPLGFDVLAAGVAVAAYGAFFNMPWRLLGVPVGVGMAAHALRWLALSWGGTLPAGAFVACVVVGTVMTPLAHWRRVPFGASAFAAVVSLIPGVYMFEAASGALALVRSGPGGAPAVAVGMVENLTTAAAILLAMVAGLLAPRMLLDPVFVRRVAHRGRGRSA